jgi:hypothetical protein
MSSIEASNYSAYRINSDTIMVEFDCKTNVKPNIKFDFSVNHSKPINIITSSSIYQQLHNEVLDRTNINSEEIKVYGYTGNKELSSISPGKNRLGTVSYPDYMISLLSEIEISSNIQHGSKVILVIDSYPSITFIEHSVLKNKLIEKDFENFCTIIQEFIHKTKCDFTLLIDSNIAKFIIDAYKQIPFSFVVSNANKITRCLCDIVFGRIISGVQNDFNGIITTTSYSIIDAFIKNKSKQESEDYSKLNLSDLTSDIHTINLRGSGLSISGNYQSHICLLLQKKSETDMIEFNEINTNKKLFELDISNLEMHPSATVLSKYLDIVNYYYKLKDINVDKYKEHMINEMLFINSIEYGSVETYMVESDFKDEIISKLTSLVQILKKEWNKIRNSFVFNKNTVAVQIEYGGIRHTPYKDHHIYTSANAATLYGPSRQLSNIDTN